MASETLDLEVEIANRRKERRAKFEARLRGVEDVGDGIVAWPVEMRGGDAHQMIVDTRSGRKVWARQARKVERDPKTGGSVNVAARELEPKAAARVAGLVKARQADAAKESAAAELVADASRSSLAGMQAAYAAAVGGSPPADPVDLPADPVKPVKKGNV